MRTRNSRHARPVALASLVGALVALAVTGCSHVPNPEQNVDSLTSVVEDPAPPKADQTYDVKLHPESIAEPLGCSPYLVVTARGTGEPKKRQLLSPVARTIEAAFPGSVLSTNLDYPASTDVNEGGTFGVRLLIDTLNEQAETCPQQKTVLLGYSQGALVIGDALSIPSGRLVGARTGTLSDTATENIAAIVLYGNPRFSAQEQFAAGDYDPKLAGILPRTPGSLTAFADRTRDYCAAKDFICQNALDLNEKGHVAYFKNGMQAEGAQFVIQHITTLTQPGSAVTSETPATPAQ